MRRIKYTAVSVILSLLAQPLAISWAGPTTESRKRPAAGAARTVSETESSVLRTTRLVQRQQELAQTQGQQINTTPRRTRPATASAQTTTAAAQTASAAVQTTSGAAQTTSAAVQQSSAVAGQSSQIQGVQDISIYGQPMYRGTGRDWSKVLTEAMQAGEVWSYNDYAHYFYNPQTNSVRVVERQGYSDQPTHEQLLSWVPPSGPIDYVRMHQAIKDSGLNQQFLDRYHNDVASGRWSQNGLFFDNDMNPTAQTTTSAAVQTTPAAVQTTSEVVQTTSAAVQTTQTAVQTTSAAVQQTSAVVNQATTQGVSQSAATTAPIYQDAQGNNIYRPTYSGSALLASPVTPVAGDGNVPSYATAATATTLPAWTYQGHMLLNFSGRQGYDLGGTFVTLGEPGIPDMNLYDQQGRDMLGDQTLTRAQIEERIAGLQKAFPVGTAHMYKIMMKADPNIWKSAPNSKIPEALIESIAQAGNTNFGEGYDADSLRQLKAMDVDKTRGELRYYNQYGTKPQYASFLNGIVNSPGLLWDQRRQEFRQFNAGDSVGQNWAYGVYDPLPAFDSRNDYGQLYLSMSDAEYNKAIGGSQEVKPTVTSSNNQTAAVAPMNNQTTSVTPTNNQTAAVTPKNNRTVSVAPKNNQTTAVTPQVTQVTYTYAQKMANLQKAFPDFSSNQYQIMMETDPNIWKSAPNSKIPEALIEPLAQAGNTSFSGNFDTASLRQLKAMDVDKTRGELRYYNQHGTKPYYAPILNGTVIAPGLLWDQRRQAFRQFNGGESIGQNWVYGVYDPLPAFDISNNYGQVYLSMSDQDYRKAVARSTWTKPTTLYPSSQAVYTDSRGNNIYRPTHSGSALLASPVTPATGDGNIPSYAAAATATTLPDWTYLGHTLLNFSGRQGYDVNGIFVTLGEPGYPE